MTFIILFTNLPALILTISIQLCAVEYFAHAEIIASREIELKLVHLIWRHGDRNPEFTYPNDPYKDLSYWPGGFGQLTQTGKRQHHELGKYFRNRYINSGFLQPTFDPKEAFVESSSINRTIQSALSNLMGFFEEDLLRADRNGSLPDDHTHKSIPVNLLPIEEDNKLLQLKAPCPKFDHLFNGLTKNSSVVRNIMQEHGWIFDYISNHSGQVITDFRQLAGLYNILYIQNLRNYTLPEWSREIYSSGLMAKLSNFAFEMTTYTEEMKRIRGGPLLKEIIRHIDIHIKGRVGSRFRKLYAYSAHDLTITTLLDTMGVYDVHQPGYASAIMIELKRNVTSGTYFVDIFYRNDTTREPYVLHPPGCQTPSCDLKTFVRNHQRYLPNNWHEECQLKP